MIELQAGKLLSDVEAWTLLRDLHYRQIPDNDEGATTVAFETGVTIAPGDPHTLPVEVLVNAIRDIDQWGWVRIETSLDAATCAAFGLAQPPSALPEIDFLKVLGLELLRPGSRVIIHVPEGNDEGDVRLIYNQPLAAVVHAGRGAADP
jgi:hypothetical protein